MSPSRRRRSRRDCGNLEAVGLVAPMKRPPFAAVAATAAILRRASDTASFQQTKGRSRRDCGNLEAASPT